LDSNIYLCRAVDSREKPTGGLPEDFSLNSPELEKTEGRVTEPSAIPSCAIVMCCPYKYCTCGSTWHWKSLWAAHWFTSSQMPADQGLSKDHLATPQHTAPASIRRGTGSSCKRGQKINM